jgi:uncharacterized protein involved in exopolysaccharide biosynthesis
VPSWLLARRSESVITTPRTDDSPRPAYDDADRLIRGVFEPPDGLALAAISRNKLIVCVFAVVLAIAGASYGHTRKRTYTASAALQVGQVNPNSPGFSGYVLSATALATAFSRSVEAEPVLAAVGHELKITEAQASARLSAAPIPESPAFRVIATGPTARAAIGLANAAADAVITYESQSNSTNPEATSLLHEYQAASLDLRRAAANVDNARSRRGYPTRASIAAEAAQYTARVKLRALEVAYTNAVATRAPSTGLVSLLAGATSASNNRSSKTQTYGLIGLLMGIVIGCVAAVLFERRRMLGPLGAPVVAQHESQQP